MVDCTKCKYFDSTVNGCSLFRVRLEKPGTTDTCDIDKAGKDK